MNNEEEEYQHKETLKSKLMVAGAVIGGSLLIFGIYWLFMQIA
jgi:hypothetical protein